MISDEERREIARKLREIDRQPLCELTDGEILDLLAVSVGFDQYWNEDFDEGLLGRLADLIEPTTCTVRMGVTGHIGVCMRCGAMVEMSTAVFDAIEALPTRYCPNCGARVTGGTRIKEVVE